MLKLTGAVLVPELAGAVAYDIAIETIGTPSLKQKLLQRTSEKWSADTQQVNKLPTSRVSMIKCVDLSAFV